MPTFAAYMLELAQRRGIRRSQDGGEVRFRLRLPDEVTLNVMTNELDATAYALVQSEPWPAPVTSSGHARFLREALVFNRNAMHHLPCAVLQDPANTSLYRLTWRVPPISQTQTEWRQQLRLFGKLSRKAWETLPKPGQDARVQRPAGDEHHVIFMP